MPALTPMTLCAFEQLARGDVSHARLYALEACMKDQTKKNEANVRRVVAAPLADRLVSDAAGAPTPAEARRRTVLAIAKELAAREGGQD